MIKKIAIGLLGILPVVFSNQVLADPAKVCNAALAGGMKDSYSLLTKQEQFSMYQDRLCKSNFSSYQSFESGAAALKLNVPFAKKLLNLGGSFEKNSQIFKGNYSTYCNSSFYDNQNSDKFSLEINTVSDALAHSWLECKKSYFINWFEENETGVYAAFFEASGYDEFSVEIEVKSDVSNTPVKINSISPMSRLSCRRGDDNVKAGYEIDQKKFVFTCMKPAHQKINLTIETSYGVTNTLTIPGERSKLTELNDMYKDLLGKTLSLEANKVPSGAIAYFEEKNCPVGWSRATTLSGRYAVGVHEANKNETGVVIGNVLGHKEDRPVGAHTHRHQNHFTAANPSEIYAGIKGAEWKHPGGTINFGIMRPQTESTGVPSTAAPYMLLSACRKN